MRHVWVVLVVLCGCLQPAAPDIAPDPSKPYVAHSDLRWAGVGCQAALLALFPSYETVRPALPAGFSPADPEVALGTNAAVGRALVIVGFVSCPEGTDMTDDLMHSTTAILVNVRGQEARNETLDFYDVSHTTSDWLWQELSYRGWQAHEEQQTLSVTAPQVGPSDVPISPARVTATYYETNGQGSANLLPEAAYAARQWDAMFWRVAGDRLLSMRLAFQEVPQLGPASCNFDRGTAPYRFMEESEGSCQGRVPSLGVLFNDFDFQATVRDRGPWP